MTFTYNDRNYPIIITKKNNKNTYIRVSRNLEINITTNYLVSDKKIKELILENKKAIINMIEKRLKEKEKDETFYLFGKKYDIIYGVDFDDVDIIDNKIFVKDNKTLNKYLTEKINEVFNEEVKKAKEIVEEDIPKFSLKIRKMTSRYGVCNRKNNTITLNFDLYKYDIICLRYVIFHELCHFTHFDHSKKFWNLVEKYVSDYKIIRKYLRE